MRSLLRSLFSPLLMGSLLLIHGPSSRVNPFQQQNPWAEVVDAHGHIRYANLTDLGVVHVPAGWMPSLPFLNGQATYHQYLTPSGDVILLPSASTLFFMAANPQASGYDQADAELGNGLGVLETMLSGYLTSADLQKMGYTDPNQFYQAVIDGRTDIWSFGGLDMLNFLSDLLSGSLADHNLYTMLLLYTPDHCAEVPGGCPIRSSLPATPRPAGCSAAFIQAGPIQASGGTSQGGKIAPPDPLVIGQDPQRRGVDIRIRALIPPVVYSTFTLVQHDDPVCVRDRTVDGTGCSAHPADPHWTTGIHTWSVCVKHTRTYPDALGSAQVSIRLADSSRAWILSDLAQAYPGAHLLHPDFFYSFSGPGTLLSDQSVVWTTLLDRIQVEDPGQYATGLVIRTTGTPVSAPRQEQFALGQFTVSLLRLSLIGNP